MPLGSKRIPRNDDMLKILKYALSTQGGLIVEMILLWLLAHFVWRGWEFGISVIAPTLAFESCLLVNYTTAKYFVWRDRKSSLWKYHLSNASVYLVKMIFILAIRYFTGIDIVLCNILSIGLAGTLNYILNDRVIFRVIPADEEEDTDQEEDDYDFFCDEDEDSDSE